MTPSVIPETTLAPQSGSDLIESIDNSRALALFGVIPVDFSEDLPSTTPEIW